MANPLALLRPDFDELEQYEPVKPLEVLAREIGVPVSRIVKLDANENLYGVIPEIREAIAAADLHIYPDPGQSALREAIADYVDVDPDQVVCGAGADDLIDILIRLVLPPAIITCPPTFGMYSFLARISGAMTVEVERDSTYRPSIDGVAAAVEAGARIVFLASPNNPTGNILAEAELERLCALDALIVVDEAYAEFSEASVIPRIRDFPNLIVLRTFSKWAGLAGLRVGYAVCHPDLAARMMAIKQPYNVNVAGDVAARAALRHRSEILESVRALVAERERMAALLASLGWLRPVPSQANFVLFHVVGRKAATLASALRKQGVLVRYYDRPGLEDCIRVSAGRPEDTDRLYAALRQLEVA